MKRKENDKQEDVKKTIKLKEAKSFHLLVEFGK